MTHVCSLVSWLARQMLKERRHREREREREREAHGEPPQQLHTLSSVARAIRVHRLHPKNLLLVCFSSHRALTEDSVSNSLACSYLSEEGRMRNEPRPIQPHKTEARQDGVRRTVRRPGRARAEELLLAFWSPTQQAFCLVASRECVRP